MTNINPKKLSGPWTEGYALDVHTTSSDFLGYDDSGREQFDTKRSEIGELLYRGKYRGDNSALDDVAHVVANFVKSKKILADIVVPVPPTRSRSTQPLFKICERVGQELKIPVVLDAVKKSGASELKNLHTFEERSKALEGAITVKSKAVGGKRVLVIDDLMRSGATITAVTKELKHGGATAVYVVAVTQTRRR